MMKRFFLKLAYNGTNYHGWQIQPNGITVQEKMEECLSNIFGEKIRTTGCGRTDAGVHAREYYLHFDMEKDIMQIDKNGLLFKINNYLPFDIAVYDIIPVVEDAHARFHPVSRTYKYYISRVKNPFNKEFSFYVYGNSDIALMNEVAGLLLNYNDFTSFSKLHTNAKTNNCKIESAFWKEENGILVFSITADRFLRNMVRAIVGTLLDVGNNKCTLHEFIEIIEGKNRSDAGLSVPACGLFLERVEYPPEIFLGELIHPEKS